MVYFKNDLKDYMDGLKIDYLIFDRDFNLLSVNEKYLDLVKNDDFIQKAKAADRVSCWDGFLYMQTIEAEGIYIVLLMDLNEVNQKTEKDIRKICHSYEEILNNFNEGIFVVDKNGKVVFINKRSEEFCGMSKDEIVGRHIGKLENDKVFWPSSTLKSFKSNKPESIIQYTNTGKKLLSTATLIRDENQEPLHAVAISCDVTELIRLRSQLEEQAELISKFSSIFEKLEIDCEQESNKKMLFSSSKMDKINYLINKVAPSDLSILLLGESGVGKSAIAKMIHEKSPRRNKPLQIINCSAIPENLLESELFGYEKGAFTGALDNGKKGLFETAMGGTVLLEEIGELSLPMQVKLLHVLQEKKIRRVGGSHEIPVDFRLIAATNQDLYSEIKAKSFREDLYYRINSVTLYIPPLRDRKEDIQVLASYFITQYNQKYQAQKHLELSALNAFYHYSWPGNVRELEHLIESLCILTDSDTITVEDLPDNFKLIRENLGFYPADANDIMPLEKALEIVESNIIQNAYNKYKSTYKVAKVLEISQATAYRKINKYCFNSTDDPDYKENVNNI